MLVGNSLKMCVSAGFEISSTLVGLLMGSYFRSKTVAKKDRTSWKLVFDMEKPSPHVPCHSVKLM